MLRGRSVLAALAASLAGCSGIKFTPDSLNGQQWPAEMSERQYFKSAGVYYRNLSGLVGHVLYARKSDASCPSVYADANLSLEQYLVPGTKLEPDTTVVERYSDRIDSRASADASVLTVVAKLAANQAAEVVVADTMALLVPDSAIPVDRLQQMASEPLREGECERFYIRGATVTTITYRTATEVSADATVSGGAFSGNGKVFNSSKSYSLDFRLGLSVLPVRPRMDSRPGVERGSRPLAGIVVPDQGLPAR